MNKMNTITVIVERNKDGLWGRSETISDFLLTGYGKNREELEVSLRKILSDYLENEGKQNADFSRTTASAFEFTYQWDLMNTEEF